MKAWRGLALLVVPIGFAAAAQSAGLTWSERSPASSPPGTAYSEATYDAARGQVVMFGGNTANGYTNGTWTWDGSDWTEQHPIDAPTPRTGHAFAYDPVRREILLFGGIESEVALQETWVWDGENWEQLAPSRSPSARYQAAMAFDPGLRQLVLFGGYPSCPDLYCADTWTWDGTTWHQLHPSASPPERYSAQLGYDPSTQTLVLFGGTNSDGTLGDTWTWDGTTWAEQHPARAPGARNGYGMDTLGSHLVLFGGAGGPDLYFKDTWTWSGATWTRLRLPQAPHGRTGVDLAYDRARSEVVLFGGYFRKDFENDRFFDDTWVLDQALGGSISLGDGPMGPVLNN